MTVGSSGTRRPRRGLAGILAAAAILAVGLQAASAQSAGSGSDKGGKGEARKQARQQSGAQATPKAPQAQDTAKQPVIRSIGSAQVAIDPATGRMRPPTAEESALLAKALYTMLSRETEDVQVTQFPDGSVRANLGEGYEEVLMATKTRKGKVSLFCVNQREQANRILAGAVTDGPDYNAKASRAAGRKGTEKSGPAVAEKE